MRRGLAALASLVLAILGAGCESPTYDLSVNLRSDFAPGTEVTQAQTELVGRGNLMELPLDRTVRLFEGVRLADFSGLPKGTVTVRVSLLREDGSVAARTEVRVTLSADTIVTVVLGRACLNVVCPGPGD